MSGPVEDEPGRDDADAGAREFERRVGALLNDSAAGLDGRTRSALTRARYAALERVEPARSPWRSWAPAGTVAMVALLVMFYVGQRPGSESAMPASPGSVDDLALVSDADGFDLSVDGDMDLDSDFYEWAAAAGGNPGSGLGS